MDLEHSFEERITQERQALAAMAEAGKDSKSVRARAAMLEEMAETFYDDLRSRMESFFDDPHAATAAAATVPSRG